MSAESDKIEELKSQGGEVRWVSSGSVILKMPDGSFKNVNSLGCVIEYEIKKLSPEDYAEIDRELDEAFPDSLFKESK